MELKTQIPVQTGMKPRHGKFKTRTLTELRELAQELQITIPLQDDLSPLARPVDLNGFIVPNSLAVHPMEGCDSTTDGSPDELTYRRYIRFARGGAGLLWFEAAAVVEEGRGNPRHLYIHEGNVQAFKEFLATVRKEAKDSMGADHKPLCILQLTHSGRYSKPYGAARPVVAFNDPILDIKAVVEAGQQFVVTDNELESLQNDFVKAALLAQEAGFDGVDIKCCHRYLASELLAGFTRPGHFGGSLENRSRFLLSTVEKVRAAIDKDLIVAVRLNASDCLPYPYAWGVSQHNALETDLTEPIWLMQQLKRLGVSLVNLTAGNPYYNPHINRPYDAPLVGGNVPDEHPLDGVARLFSLAAQLQHAVPQIAVVGAGYSWLRHHFPHAAAANLAQKNVTFAGAGRLAFAYPNFAKDILQTGKLDPTKTCIACSMCSQIMRDGGTTTGCVVRDKEIYLPVYKRFRELNKK